MNKLASILAAGALALSLSSIASAADESKPTGEKSRAQPPEGSATTTTVPGGDVTEREQEYLSSLKKCESKTGGDKQQCIDELRRQHGQK